MEVMAEYHECMTMDAKDEPQMNIDAANPTIQTRPIAVSELLEDPGNCRQLINQELSLHLLTGSLFTEKQKLRHVLDWAHSFLSGDSDVRHEVCRADSLILANEEQRETQSKSPVCKHPPAPDPVSCTAGGNGVAGGGRSMQTFWHLEPSNYENRGSNFALSFIPQGNEVTWPEYKEVPENMINMKIQDITDKQTPSQDNTCKTRCLCVSNQNQHTRVQSERDISGDWLELSYAEVEVGKKKEVVGMAERKGKVKDRDSSPAFMRYTKNNMSNSEPERTQEQMGRTSNFTFSCHLKIPPTITVYEQYQLCVDQLHDLRVRQSQQMDPAKQSKTSEETGASVEAPSTLTADLESNSNTCGEVMKGSAGGIHPTGYTPTVEEPVACTPNQGLFPKRRRCNRSLKRHWSDRGQKKNSGGRGASLRHSEVSRVSLSSLNNKEILQRAQPSGEIKHRQRQTNEEKVKPTSACRDSHKGLQPTRIHTPPPGDLGPVSPASGASWFEQTDFKYTPAGVPACARWLSLPDEVWLSVLSLLPHSDVCRVLQVCRRLHTLAADHTLWKSVRIENSDLTDRWLLCLSRRRPRSLCLYSCSGLSLTSCGLETFFTLCRKTLEDLKVTSCTGRRLHGDQVLCLIGQLCEQVTCVDVSWSGATDTGVKALSDCCTGLQLKSVVLNGCKVSDDPLMKLAMRHKESVFKSILKISLCRLELFGCQFLTASCLQTVYEMCPGLQHLNIGQVPKVNARSLTVMTSQLRCLISLTLTGLQAVSDATMDTLLQSCVKLQSLTLSSCPGVTDLTLHSISKYTPCIRSLDVSSCKAVTDVGVQYLALGCGRLQQLDISSTGTGNRGVTLLASYCSRHLETVKLSFCHITFENILKLCRRCKRLKVLHLYGCAHPPTEGDIRAVNATVKVYPQA